MKNNNKKKMNPVNFKIIQIGKVFNSDFPVDYISKLSGIKTTDLKKIAEGELTVKRRLFHGRTVYCYTRDNFI